MRAHSYKLGPRATGPSHSTLSSVNIDTCEATVFISIDGGCSVDHTRPPVPTCGSTRCTTRPRPRSPA